MTGNTFNYNFENKGGRASFKIFASKKKKSMQSLITEALKNTYPELKYHDNDTIIKERKKAVNK